MSDTFIKLIDESMRIRVWNKFMTELGVTDMDTQSALMPKGVAQRHIAEKKGNDQLPFMNMWRPAPLFAWDRQQSGIGRIGLSTGATQAGQIDDVKTVPITLNYDLWVWSKNMDDVNAIMEKFMFWIYQDPNLDMNLNGEYPLEFDLHFGNPVDESGVEQMFDKGLYFVMRFPITLDGWIFNSSFVKIIKKIIIQGLDYTVNPGGNLLFTSTTVGKQVVDDIEATDVITAT